MCDETDMTDDEFKDAIDENIRLGYMEVVGIHDNGSRMLRLTEAGKRHVEQQILGDPGEAPDGGR